MTYSWRGGFGGLEVLATAGCCWCVQFGTHQVACPAPLIANPLSAALSDYAFVHMEKESHQFLFVSMDNIFSSVVERNFSFILKIL